MAKPDVGAMLKKRMVATRDASELEIGDEAYEKIFQLSTPDKHPVIREIPMDKLVFFFTTDIGFQPYPPERLKALAAQIAEEGLIERIIVRPIPGSDQYEILAGEHRTKACRLNGWPAMPAEIIEADDARATSIAIATNLLRRPELSIIERGKAYKALLDAQRKQGFRSDLQTSGENRQKFLAREIVAEFFGVTEYEIRKAIKLTQLIPSLQEILLNSPKQLNLACAELIADYGTEAQGAFVEMCTIQGYRLNKATVKHIISRCPPSSADKQQIFAAWREARATAERKKAAPSKTISFNRQKFAPYLEKLGSDQALEQMFLEFLQTKISTTHH